MLINDNENREKMLGLLKKGKNKQKQKEKWELRE